MAKFQHVISAILPTVLSEDVEPNCLIRFLDNVTDWNLFSPTSKGGNLQGVTGHINTFLGSSKHRIEGLLLLRCLVDQCNAEIFQKNINTWTNLLIKILQSGCLNRDKGTMASTRVVHKSPCPANQFSLTCVVLSEIVHHCKTFPEVSREISTSFVPQLVPLLLGASSQWSSQSIVCLNSCLRNFPGPCGPFKGKIENFIVTYLDDEYPLEAAEVCFSLLAGCGGCGNLGLKHTEGWTKQGRTLLSSLWSTIGALYEGLDQDLPKPEKSGLPLKSPPNNQPMRFQVLTSRLEMLCRCLSHLLSEKFDSTAHVPVNEVMTFVRSTLAVNNNMLLSRPTTDHLTLAYNLPRMHLSVLKLLSSLIRCVKKILLPHSSTIRDLLTESLKWTQSDHHSNNHNKSYSLLRETTYDVACDWLRAVGSSSSLGSQGSEFIKCILSDISVADEELTIGNIKGKESEGTSKKRKKGGGYQEISKGQGLAKKVNRAANQNTCYKALQTLRLLLNTDGSSLKEKDMRDVMACLMDLCVKIQQSSPITLPGPYSQPMVLSELYRTVTALVLVPHPCCPPPIHLAIKVLQSGLQDNDLQVVGACREGLTVMEAIIHPRAPCLTPAIKFTDPVVIETSANQNPSDQNPQYFETGMAGDSNRDKTAVQYQWNKPESYNLSNSQLELNMENVPKSTSKFENVCQVRETTDSSASMVFVESYPEIVPMVTMGEKVTQARKRMEMTENNQSSESEPIPSSSKKSRLAKDIPDESVGKKTKSASINSANELETVKLGDLDAAKVDDNSSPSDDDDEDDVTESFIPDDVVETSQCMENLQQEAARISPEHGESNIEQTSDLEDMLSSFVDASPDHD